MLVTGSLQMMWSGCSAAPVMIDCTGAQVRRAWQTECRGSRNQQNSKLCTDEPAAFRTRLQGHVATVWKWGLSAADVGVLAARDVALVAGEPRALASRISALASCFRVPPFPAMQSADALLAVPKPASRAQLRCLVLHGPNMALYTSMADLEGLMASYVRLGVFAAEDASRQGCLCNPSLVKTTSWRVLVSRIAAVRATGGTSEDDLTAAMCAHSADCMLEAGMLQEYSGCAPRPFAFKFVRPTMLSGIGDSTSARNWSLP
jgi:hypothetical protein